MARSRRPRYSLSLIIQSVLIVLTAAYAGWRFYQYRQTADAPPVVYFQPEDDAPPPPGYARFTLDDLSVNFIYPMSQDPIQAMITAPSSVRAGLRTRNFRIYMGWSRFFASCTR